MQYEVSLTVEGAEVKTETHTNEGAAYQAADDLAKEAAQEHGEVPEGEGITWYVYVTPHYCRHDTDDCVCPSWLEDHKPYRSG